MRGGHVTLDAYGLPIWFRHAATVRLAMSASSRGVAPEVDPGEGGGEGGGKVLHLVIPLAQRSCRIPVCVEV